MICIGITHEQIEGAMTSNFVAMATSNVTKDISEVIMTTRRKFLIFDIFCLTDKTQTLLPFKKKKMLVEFRKMKIKKKITQLGTLRTDYLAGETKIYQK